MASGTDANPEVTLASLESARATRHPSFVIPRRGRAYRALARAFHPDKGGDEQVPRGTQGARTPRSGVERVRRPTLARRIRGRRSNRRVTRDEARRRPPPATAGQPGRADARPRGSPRRRSTRAISSARAKARRRHRARLAERRRTRVSPRPRNDKKNRNRRDARRGVFPRAAARGDRPAALLDADGAPARRGSRFEPHVVRAQALERLGGTERRRRATRSTRSARTSDSESDDDERVLRGVFLLRFYDSSEESDRPTTTTTTTTTTGRRVVTGTTAGTTAVASIVPRRRGTRSTTS